MPAFTSGVPSPSIAYASTTPSGEVQKRVSCFKEERSYRGASVGFMRQLEIRLLGRFEVLVDSRPVPADAWAQRRAADLVKLLALVPGHRMPPRDEVLETLWPQLGADAAAASLHKAASYARSAR